MENKMAKTRITLGGGAIDSPLNFSVGQKISVLGKNFNQKSKNPFKNLSVMLNLFQHLTNKHRLTQDLCLLTSFDVGQMLKQVQHDESLMLGCVVLSDNDDKQLNKLINQELKNNAKIKPSCRTRFGIYPENGCSECFNLFVNRKIFNKWVSSLRCLFVRCRNKFGMTSDYSWVKACIANGKCQSGRVCRFDAPQGLTPQGLAQC